MGDLVAILHSITRYKISKILGCWYLTLRESGTILKSMRGSRKMTNVAFQVQTKEGRFES